MPADSMPTLTEQGLPPAITGTLAVMVADRRFYRNQNQGGPYQRHVREARRLDSEHKSTKSAHAHSKPQASRSQMASAARARRPRHGIYRFDAKILDQRRPPHVPGMAYLQDAEEPRHELFGGDANYFAIVQHGIKHSRRARHTRRHARERHGIARPHHITNIALRL